MLDGRYLVLPEAEPLPETEPDPPPFTEPDPEPLPEREPDPEPLSSLPLPLPLAEQAAKSAETVKIAMLILKDFIMRTPQGLCPNKALFCPNTTRWLRSRCRGYCESVPTTETSPVVELAAPDIAGGVNASGHMWVSRAIAGTARLGL